jgi:hypothetical protein
MPSRAVARQSRSQFAAGSPIFSFFDYSLLHHWAAGEACHLESLRNRFGVEKYTLERPDLTLSFSSQLTVCNSHVVTRLDKRLLMDDSSRVCACRSAFRHSTCQTPHGTVQRRAFDNCGQRHADWFCGRPACSRCGERSTDSWC